MPVPHQDELIVAAAICKKGMIYTMPRPARHHNILHNMHKAIGMVSPQEQGFLTSHGRFVGREVACLIAKAHNQIIEKTGPSDILFSEDLW